MLVFEYKEPASSLRDGQRTRSLARSFSPAHCAMIMNGLVATVTLALVSSAAARTFTIYNQCPFTIWPAVRRHSLTDLNA